MNFKENLMLPEITKNESKIIEKTGISSIKAEPSPAKPTQKATASSRGAKTQYMLALLQQAGRQGITWASMQAALRAKFGNAPKKRRSLYLLLEAQPHWYKVTGRKGVVTYYLGKAPNKGQG
jgi:hypothetical protein